MLQQHGGALRDMATIGTFTRSYKFGCSVHYFSKPTKIDAFGEWGVVAVIFVEMDVAGLSRGELTAGEVAPEEGRLFIRRLSKYLIGGLRW